jgi:hypothetical protein
MDGAAAEDKYCTSRGIGRSNYLPEWELAKARGSDSYSNDFKISYIPYSRTPPRDSQLLKAPFSATQLKGLSEHLNGLVTVPPDHRLSFAFQNKNLLGLDGSVDSSLQEADYIRDQLQGLADGGGMFEVWDFDEHNSAFSYSLFNTTTAADAEEFILQIPPAAWKINSNGVPLHFPVVEPWCAPWRRLM